MLKKKTSEKKHLTINITYNYKHLTLRGYVPAAFVITRSETLLFSSRY